MKKHQTSTRSRQARAALLACILHFTFCIFNWPALAGVNFVGVFANTNGLLLAPANLFTANIAPLTNALRAAGYSAGSGGGGSNFVTSGFTGSLNSELYGFYQTTNYVITGAGDASVWGPYYPDPSQTGGTPFYYSGTILNGYTNLNGSELQFESSGLTELGYTGKYYVAFGSTWAALLDTNPVPVLTTQVFTNLLLQQFTLTSSNGLLSAAGISTVTLSPQYSATITNLASVSSMVVTNYNITTNNILVVTGAGSTNFNGTYYPNTNLVGSLYLGYDPIYTAYTNGPNQLVYAAGGLNYWLISITNGAWQYVTSPYASSNAVPIGSAGVWNLGNGASPAPAVNWLTYSNISGLSISNISHYNLTQVLNGQIITNIYQ